MDIMSEEGRRKKLQAAHRRIVQSILEKDVDADMLPLTSILPW